MNYLARATISSILLGGIVVGMLYAMGSRSGVYFTGPYGQACSPANAHCLHNMFVVPGFVAALIFGAHLLLRKGASLLFLWGALAAVLGVVVGVALTTQSDHGRFSPLVLGFSFVMAAIYCAPTVVPASALAAYVAGRALKLNSDLSLVDGRKLDLARIAGTLAVFIVVFFDVRYFFLTLQFDQERAVIALASPLFWLIPVAGITAGIGLWSYRRWAWWLGVAFGIYAVYNDLWVAYTYWSKIANWAPSYEMLISLLFDFALLFVILHPRTRRLCGR